MNHFPHLNVKISSVRGSKNLARKVNSSSTIGFSLRPFARNLAVTRVYYALSFEKTIEIRRFRVLQV